MRLVSFIILFLPLAFTAQLPDTSRCFSSCCCKNDPTPAGVMISHVHNKNEWMVSYRYMNMGMSGIATGTRHEDKNDVFVNYLMAPNKMRMDMHMIMAMYGITNRFTVMTMFSYNVNSMEMDMFDMSGHVHPGMTMGHMNHNMKTSGLGDIKLHLLYGLVKKQNYQLLLSAGINIPTGNIQIKGTSNDAMYPDKRLPYSMQMGSGTIDVLPCINYVYQKQRITFSLLGSGTVRTQFNDVGYKLGNDATVNTWFAYQWLNFLTSSVRLEGNIAGAINGYDPTLYYYNELSANPHNYGGQRVNCFVGSVFQFRKRYLKNNRFGIEYGIPLYQSLNGTQMQLKQTLYASWALTF